MVKLQKCLSLEYFEIEMKKEIYSNKAHNRIVYNKFKKYFSSIFLLSLEQINTV